LKTEAAGRALVVLGLAIMLLLAWLGTFSSPLRQYSLDASAQRYVDDGLKRALLTFGTARALGAVLSVAQGTDLAFEPGGVGIKVSPGQILHPITDLLRQFADLMLTASIAFGAMEVLIRIGSHWTVTLALSIAAVAWGAHYWREHVAPTWLAKVVLVLLLLRFIIPIVSIGSDGIYTVFMSDEYAASQQAIQASSDQIGNEVAARPESKPSAGPTSRLLAWLSPKTSSGAVAESKAEPGFIDSLREWWGEKGDIGARLKKFVQDAERLSEHVVKLMALFLLQTLVIPLILGWALLKVAQAVLHGGRRIPAA
jgi:hypothetical protein